FDVLVADCARPAVDELANLELVGGLAVVCRHGLSLMLSRRAAEPSACCCVGQLVMTPAITGRGDKSRPVVCAGGSWRSFARSFSDEPEIQANQKQGEMYETAKKQEFRCHS